MAKSLDPGADEFRPNITNNVRSLIAIVGSLPPPMPIEPLFLPHTAYFVPAAYQYYVHHAPMPPLSYVAPVLPPLPKAPTRAIVLSAVPADVSEATVRMEMEPFGETRCVQMERVLEGIVTVHFFDVRVSEMALHSIRAQHISHQSRFRDYVASGAIQPHADLRYHGRELGTIAGVAVWAHFVIPFCNWLPDGNNQGTIVLFNLDPDVSSSALEEIFRDFGDIRDIRETPLKKQQRFIEFFDVRDAAGALAVMNGKELNGRTMVIEFSRPGGFGKIAGDELESGRSDQHWDKQSDRSLSMSVLADVEPSAQALSKVGKVKVKGYGKLSRRWKNSKKLDIRFFVNDDSSFDNACGDDKRTTVMIKNIPNKYSQQLLLDILDRHCVGCNDQISDRDNDPLSAYDFLYLPIDFTNKCNVGYGFVNMTSPQAAVRLYKEFHLHKWREFNSRKICEISYARVQGLESLKVHFKNSKFPLEMAHYLPATFCPPRDGKIRSCPIPLVDRCKHYEISGNEAAC